MSQDGDPSFKAGLFPDEFPYPKAGALTVLSRPRRAIGTFRDDNYAMGFAPLVAVHNPTTHIIEVEGNLGHQNRFRASGKARMEGNEARVTAHHFNYVDPLVGGGSIPDLVDRVHHRIGCRVEPDRLIGAYQIIVDGSRNANDGYAQVALRANPPRIEPPPPMTTRPSELLLPNVVQGPLLTSWRSKLLAPGRSQDSPAPMDDVGDGTGGHDLETRHE